MLHITRIPLVLAVICPLLTGLILVAQPGPVDTGASEAVAAAAQPVGTDAALTAGIEAAAMRAAEEPTEAGTTLLPAGTVVDGVRWSENVLEVDLTFPADFATGPEAWYLTDLDLEALEQTLTADVRALEGFGGLRLRARAGPDGQYGTMGQFLIEHMLRAATPPPAVSAPAEQPEPQVGGEPMRGPVTQAGRQPAGALSGVVIYTSAGHGWTAGTSSDWYLQRPVLLNMAEDYGNLDQLNYFVHFAYNAGATVVPFRPVGWQPIEIVLDQDDPGVTYTGSWTNGSSSKYYENHVTESGVVYKWCSAAGTETATARFTPTITVTDFYPVYCFAVSGTNRALQTYRIAHSGGVTAVSVDHRLVGSGWVWLGEYYLEAGGTNYVEITNESPTSGAIIADAIRWGGGVGDILRPGPGVISGYPRDEECSRYWAESELGNHAVGFDSDIWDGSTDDGSDNVRTAAKWGREMNVEPPDLQTDRWKRIYLEFHTNATGGGARGQICLITTLGETTYQQQYANILSDEVDADMLIMDDTFEWAWVDRAGATYTAAYGAICTEANGNEFDATIVELAFHDDPNDAALLRDDRVRTAMAKSCVQGITRFLNTLPGSQVPLAFAPDTPRYFRVEDAGGGNVTLSWVAPLNDGARGDPATGYVVYQSTNGYGFGSPIVLGNVLTTTIGGVPVGETRYFRVAATNSGGESMPSEVLAVRRPASGTASVLIVNGFDRLRRQINPIQTFTQPPAYAGDWIERQKWRESNACDYVVQHAEALAAADYGFASAVNEAVADGYLLLDDFEIVDWILGTESGEDAALTGTEQTKLTSYMTSGGSLFISGADLGYDLIGLGHGAAFMQNQLKTGYAANDANTFQVGPPAGGIFMGMSAFDFDPAAGAAYEVREPDVLSVQSGGLVCLNYTGGGAAAVQYAGAVYNAVTFGFPFEVISSPAVRAEVMERVMEFLASAIPPPPFDYNGDGDVDWQDFSVFLFCFKGPDFDYVPGHICLKEDGDADSDSDLADFWLLQQVYTGPLPPP